MTTTTTAAKAEPMAPGEVAAFTLRLPVQLIDEIDAAAEKLSDDTGFKVTRTDAIIRMLRQALRARR